MVHSKEWATGSRFFLDFDLISAFSLELVVHSKEWATGSRFFLAFDLISAFFPGASGPLERVVHWLTTFWGFWPSFGTFPGS